MNPAARIHPWLLLLACAIPLGAALLAQFGFGLEPCHLCTLQRIPYGLTALFALIAATERDARSRAFLLGLCALGFASNVGIAGFHVGVEQHLWESACSGDGGKLASSAASLLARLKSGPPPVPCDSIAFSFLGISMAGYNVLASTILALYAAWTARGTWRAG